MALIDCSTHPRAAPKEWRVQVMWVSVLKLFSSTLFLYNLTQCQSQVLCASPRRVQLQILFVIQKPERWRAPPTQISVASNRPYVDSDSAVHSPIPTEIDQYSPPHLPVLIRPIIIRGQQGAYRFVITRTRTWRRNEVFSRTHDSSSCVCVNVLHLVPSSPAIRSYWARGWITP